MFRKGDAVWVPWGPKKSLWEATVTKVDKRGIYITFPGWSKKYNKWYKNEDNILLRNIEPPTDAVNVALPTDAVNVALPTDAVNVALPTDAVNVALPTDAVNVALPTDADILSPCAKQSKRKRLCAPTVFVPESESEIDSIGDPEYIPPELCSYSSCSEDALLSCSCCERPLCRFHCTTRCTEHNVDSVYCNYASCESEIFICCPICLVYLCFEHAETTCQIHNATLYELDLIPIEKEASEVQIPETPIQPPSGDKTVDKINKDMLSEKQNTNEKVLNPKKRGRPLSGSLNRIENKRSKDSGDTYFTQKTKNGEIIVQIPQKQIKPPCNCKDKCCDKITEEMRHQIFNEFISSNDVTIQRMYIVHLIEEKEVSKGSNLSSRRKKTRIYKLKFENTDVSVCQTLFLNTLGITETAMRTALKKRLDGGLVEGDRRGEYLKTRDNVESAKMRENVKAHIMSFPTIDSHYCRESSNRLYLEEHLNISTMYRLYLEKCQINNESCSYSMYAKIFREMNLSFHVPKKDQCDFCTSYSNGSVEFQTMKKQDYEQHVMDKEAARRLKEEAKVASKASENTTITAVFDLQKVMLLPHSNASSFYYSRKFSAYNFTIKNLTSKETHCYVWHEGIARRGSAEIATCLYTWLKDVDSRGFREVILFSDATYGQNRNIQLAAMFRTVVETSTNLASIHHIFFVSGHSQNEGDSVHSMIERSTRNRHIYTPMEWFGIIKGTSADFKVVELCTKDIIDWKTISDVVIPNKHSVEDGSKFFISKVVQMNYNKGDMHIRFKYHFDDDFIILNTGRRIRRPINFQHLEMKSLRLKPPCIKLDKLKDLQKLCNRKLIPDMYHTFYLSFFEGDESDGDLE